MGILCAVLFVASAASFAEIPTDARRSTLKIKFPDPVLQQVETNPVPGDEVRVRPSQGALVVNESGKTIPVEFDALLVVGETEEKKEDHIWIPKLEGWIKKAETRWVFSVKESEVINDYWDLSDTPMVGRRIVSVRPDGFLSKAARPNSRAIGRFAYGEPFIVEASVGEWFRLSGKEGWVHRRFFLPTTVMYDHLTAQIEKYHEAEDYYRRALFAANFVDPADALEDLDKALKLEPRVANYYISGAKIYAHLKRYREAYEFFEIGYADSQKREASL